MSKYFFFNCHSLSLYIPVVVVTTMLLWVYYPNSQHTGQHTVYPIQLGLLEFNNIIHTSDTYTQYTEYVHFFLR